MKQSTHAILKIKINLMALIPFTQSVWFIGMSCNGLYMSETLVLKMLCWTSHCTVPCAPWRLLRPVVTSTKHKQTRFPGQWVNCISLISLYRGPWHVHRIAASRGLPPQGLRQIPHITGSVSTAQPHILDPYFLGLFREFNDVLGIASVAFQVSWI